MTRRPHASVCVPVRDQARFVEAAVTSALRQSVQDLEVIVCDDGSTDDTVERLCAIDDDRLRVVGHPRPKGIAAARNHCLGLARGEFVGWLDADDRWAPEMLEQQTERLRCSPGAAFVHGGHRVVDEHGRRLPDWPWPFAADVVEPGAEAFAALILGNYVTTSTVVARTAAHAAAGPFRDLPTGSDWDQWLRLALVGDVAFTARPVADYRQHADSATARARRSGTRFASDVAVVRGALRAARAAGHDAAGLRARAEAALAAKAMGVGVDLMTQRERRRAAAAVLRATSFGTGRRPDVLRVAGAMALGREYPAHVASRRALRRIVAPLAETRSGPSWERRLRDDPDWLAELRGLAAEVRRAVPRRARVAVIDKWDPTLLRWAERRGGHFPDRSLMPDGYPPSDEAAIGHLHDLQRRGTTHLVVPSTSMWWLEHYRRFSAHLEREHRCVSAIDEGMIFALAPVAA